MKLEGEEETFILCRSVDRKEKERAINERKRLGLPLFPNQAVHKFLSKLLY
jgi:hypothetical protein